MKAVVYRRAAAADRTGDWSLARQEQACREYVERRGWEVVEVYTDAGEPGTRSERPAWRRLLDEVPRGAFDVLVATSLDRFSRNANDAIAAFDGLDDSGGAVVTADGQIDGTTAQGRLTLHTMLLSASAGLGR